jgi:hypothetical protein
VIHLEENALSKMEKKTLQQHINDDIDELDNVDLNPQRRRHIISELDQLEQYQSNHPDTDHDPNALELFCDLNPDEPECKVFDV